MKCKNEQITIICEVVYTLNIVISTVNPKLTMMFFYKALNISIQSYANKVIINVGVDLDVIPDPHHLCHLMIEALHAVKSAALERTSGDLEV